MTTPSKSIIGQDGAWVSEYKRSNPNHEMPIYPEYGTWLMQRMRSVADAINPCIATGPAGGPMVSMRGNSDPR